MRLFTRRMYEQTVGGRKGFPPWPFEADAVPCRTAYGIYVRKYEPQEDGDRFNEPKLVKQPANCRAGFLFYLASRLTFVDLLALHRSMIRALEERLVDLNKWLDDQPLDRWGEASRSSMRSRLEKPIHEGFEHLAMNLATDDNRRFFEDSGLGVAGESMSYLIADLYEADSLDKLVTEVLEEAKRALFETLIAPIMVKCEQCANPRTFGDVAVVE